MADGELVVLVDEDGHATGTAEKATVHTDQTPLHLAFSCYVFDASSRLLVTQRATAKQTWPGVWTNTVCGHPAPAEDIEDAVRRRAEDELGLQLTGVQLVLPTFRYQATMDNGVRENELCPVFTADTEDQPEPDGSEVADVEWVPWREFRDDVVSGRREVSPWCHQQVVALAARELPEGGFAPGLRTDLPPAARADLEPT